MFSDIIIATQAPSMKDHLVLFQRRLRSVFDTLVPPEVEPGKGSEDGY